MEGRTVVPQPRLFGINAAKPTTNNNRGSYENTSTGKLVTCISELLSKIDPQFKDHTAAKFYSTDLANLRKICCDLDSSLEELERDRSEFSFDYRLLKEKQRLTLLSESTEKSDNARMSSYQAAMQSMREKGDSLHQKIIELQSKAALDEISRIVVNSQIHEEIDEEINQINAKIAAKNRSCFCSFLFGGADLKAEIEKLHEKLAQLDQQRKDLDSKDAAKVSSIVINRLTKKRDKAAEELQKLIANPPVKDGEQLRARLTTIEADLAQKRLIHERRLNESSMQHCIRFYVAVLSIIDKLTKAVNKDNYVDKPDKDNFAAIREIKNIFIEYQAKLRAILSDFYYPEVNAFKFEHYLAAFEQLDANEKTRIASGLILPDLSADRQKTAIIKISAN